MANLSKEDILKGIETMSVMELAELIKALELVILIRHLYILSRSLFKLFPTAAYNPCLPQAPEG